MGSRAGAMIQNNKGFLLITSYFFIAVLSMLSIAFFTRGIVYMNGSERNRNRVVAFHMAEAGLNQVVSTLRSTSNPEQLSSSDLSTNYTALGNQGGYDIAATKMASLIWRVVVKGHSPSSDTTGRGYEQREIVAYVNVEEPTPFDQAIFSADYLRMSGFAVVDSYDSRVADYDPDNPGENGDLHTNSVESGDVHLQGGDLTYRGDIIIGPGGDPDVVVSKSGTVSISGSITAASAELDFPTPTTPSITSSGDLSLTGNTVHTLQAGDYVFNSISIGGNAILETTGKVNIYVTGGFSIGGAGDVTVQSGTPSDFMVVMSGGGDVSFGSNSLQFHGAIYAPNSTIHLSNTSEYYGAIIANTLQQSGDSQFHYDEGLQELEVDGLENDVRVLSWVESDTVVSG